MLKRGRAKEVEVVACERRSSSSRTRVRRRAAAITCVIHCGIHHCGPGHRPILHRATGGLLWAGNFCEVNLSHDYRLPIIRYRMAQNGLLSVVRVAPLASMQVAVLRIQRSTPTQCPPSTCLHGPAQIIAPAWVFSPNARTYHAASFRCVHCRLSDPIFRQPYQQSGL